MGTVPGRTDVCLDVHTWAQALNDFVKDQVRVTASEIMHVPASSSFVGLRKVFGAIPEMMHAPALCSLVEVSQG